MYVPKQFREDRLEVLIEALRSIQLAALTTFAGGEYLTTHTPMVAKLSPTGELTLESHVARPNPHWQALSEPLPSIAVFQGPQAYVSPSWYPSKKEHGKVVPTWNYIAVHAHGRLEAIHEDGWLKTHLNDLTLANEAEREHPWAVADAPEAFIDSLARTIVGLRLTVSRLEGSWKLVQHKTQADRHGVIAGMSGSGDAGAHAVAEMMKTLERVRATQLT